jgi:KDO2-lipid IV(A) lauroyltransferase
MAKRITFGRRIRAIGEIILVQLGMLLIPFLPRRVILGVANFLGSMAFRCARRDRRIALANIDLVYGDSLDASAKRNLARAAFCSYALTMLDLFWFAVFGRRRISKYLEFDPAVRQSLSEARIIISAHFGNWEVMGHAAAIEGYRLATVAKSISNPVVYALLNRGRTNRGQLIIPREGAMRQIFKLIRSEQDYKLALLLDQETMPKEGGVFVDFFGVPTPISNAPSELALRLNLPMVMILCRWDPGRGKYLVYGSPVFRGEPGMTGEALTKSIAGRVEDAIRQHPGNWLWMYKRWKHKLPGFPVERYPFYADY